ncbi:MAG: undecaprenyl-diphosphate phosphatase [Myxococcales bacterium]|nr:undecaprenyl-diphosphate phosphatase [Myxococcales bacterium]
MLTPGTALGYGMAAFLGAVQGVAEFLPISSSGHLSLFEAWLGVDAATAGHSFNIVVHAGTLLAVLLVFRRDLLELLRGLVDPAAVPWARPLAAAIVVGSLPLVVVLAPGIEDLVVAMEGNTRAVGAALILTAAMLGFSHRRQTPQDDRNQPPSLGRALLIGIAQLIAVAPGISRSGSTIAAALALGLGRARAARFSFLLSIPAITAATGKEALEVLTSDVPVAFAPGPFALGFVVSFLVGFASLRLLLAMIERVGLWPFVPYLVLVGTAAILLAP